MEESWAEIHNKLGPKFKIHQYWKKLKKISIQMCFLGIKPMSAHMFMHYPTAGPSELI